MKSKKIQTPEKSTMEPSLILNILIYLYRHDAINEQQINVTTHLKTLRDKDKDRDNNFRRIVMALGRIKETGFASYGYSPEKHELNKTIDGKFCDLDNTDVNMTFHFNGWMVINDFIAKNEQNASNLATNDSVKALNTITPKIYQRQIRLTWITILVAAFSTAGLLASTYYASQSITAKQLDTTNRTLQRMVITIDSLSNRVGRIPVPSNSSTLAVRSHIQHPDKVSVSH